MDPRNHKTLWYLIRATGGADAWTDPLPDRDAARCERVASWTAAVGIVVVVLAIMGAIVSEGVRACA